MKAVFDSNVIIDYLNGAKEAKQEMHLYKNMAISIVTYIEVLVGIKDAQTKKKVKKFLAKFEVINVTQEVADAAIELRVKYKLKIPDALVLATAVTQDAILVTRNTKDFAASIPIVRVPYKL
jgi:predicted nucleic acid-binding protein